MREKRTKRESIKGDSIQSALIKKALGYDVTETIEEYVENQEGEIKLSKKKITKKNVPPDVTAIKILLEENKLDVKNMSDEELESEKIRLLELLSNYQKKEK